VGLPPCWIPSTTESTFLNYEGKRTDEDQGLNEMQGGHLARPACSLGLWRVLGLGDDFDSGADRNEVVEFDHVGVT